MRSFEKEIAATQHVIEQWFSKGVYCTLGQGLSFGT